MPYGVASLSTFRIVSEVIFVAYLRSRSRLTLRSSVSVVPAERCVSAAKAVVVVIAPTDKTVIADNAVAITFVLMLFFFMMISPFI